MKCKNCGAELKEQQLRYLCDFCGSSFPKNEREVSMDANLHGFIIQGTVLQQYCGSASVVDIPEGITVIGNNAFSNNTCIEEVKFPASVVCIEDNAFDRCVNLRNLINYDTIQHIGNESFRATGLSEIKIGPNVSYLGKYCFSRCNNLQTVVYRPDKNLVINHAFAYCAKLENVEMNRHYFFPALKLQREVKNNPNNKRPTFSDSFVGTPFLKIVKNNINKSLKENVCFECGEKLKKTIFHVKCEICNIDYKN